MEEILFDISAFRFWRTPPLVLRLMGPFPDVSTPSGKRTLKHLGTLFGGIELPIHVMVDDPRLLRNNVTVKTHLWSGELPRGAIRDTELGVCVASPLFALLSLTPHLSVNQLSMAMYELVGTFAVYRPNQTVHDYLQQLIDRQLLPLDEGWRPCLTPDGKLTGLWQRNPLVTLDELRSFARSIYGMRGAKRIATAVENVFGITSSPFEAQAAMLIGLSRRRGGRGIRPIECARTIRLEGDARRIHPHHDCVADLYIEGDGAHRSIVIECQGQDFHSTGPQARHDDNRALALQSMGYTVIALRSEQISDPVRFESVIRYISRELGRPIKPQTAKLEQAEKNLRRDLFVDWWGLGL